VPFSGRRRFAPQFVHSVSLPGLRPDIQARQASRWTKIMRIITVSTVEAQPLSRNLYRIASNRMAMTNR
jgi:hypothetical protein